MRSELAARESDLAALRADKQRLLDNWQVGRWALLLARQRTACVQRCGAFARACAVLAYRLRWRRAWRPRSRSARPSRPPPSRCVPLPSPPHGMGSLPRRTPSLASRGRPPALCAASTPPGGDCRVPGYRPPGRSRLAARRQRLHRPHPRRAGRGRLWFRTARCGPRARPRQGPRGAPRAVWCGPGRRALPARHDAPAPAACAWGGGGRSAAAQGDGGGGRRRGCQRCRCWWRGRSECGHKGRSGRAGTQRWRAGGCAPPGSGARCGAAGGIGAEVVWDVAPSVSEATVCVSACMLCVRPEYDEVELRRLDAHRAMSRALAADRMQLGEAQRQQVRSTGSGAAA